MEPFIGFLLVVVVFYIGTVTVRSQDSCTTSRCGSSELGIQFPFGLEDDHKQGRCGYPGFELTCDASKRTVLELGTSGKFLVREINYVAQEIEIYDEDNCLPKRLLTLDLSESVFSSYYPQSITFYNCSSKFSGDYLLPISCLRSSNYTVYAAYTFSPPFVLSTCVPFTTIGIPTFRGYGRAFFSDINDSIRLLWSTPDCGNCIVNGGKCGFKNKDGDEIGCFNGPRRGLSRTLKYVLGIGLGIPGLACLLLIGFCVFARYKSYGVTTNLRHIEASSTVLPQPHLFVVGLDESIIQSYPKIVLGESKRLVNPEDNICAICLSEYKSKETLKSIPDCKHCFHAACIDEWLRRNVTCPLCRNYPKPVLPPV
ncbi:hypothetical protein ACHQM5_012016 [Ranunculus cassubicifolius]